MSIAASLARANEVEIEYYDIRGSSGPELRNEMNPARQDPGRAFSMNFEASMARVFRQQADLA